MGQTVDIKFSIRSAFFEYPIKPHIDDSTVTSGWKVMLESKHKVCIDQFMSTLTNHVGCVRVCIQVNKYDVMKYTGVGEPPFCMITINPISDEATPSNLECTVNLVGADVPNSLQLTRDVEYSNIQLCELC